MLSLVFSHLRPGTVQSRLQRQLQPPCLQLLGERQDLSWKAVDALSSTLAIEYGQAA
jgi:hypothetical protein